MKFKRNTIMGTIALILIISIVGLIVPPHTTQAEETEGYQSPLSHFVIGEVNFTVYAIAPLQWKDVGSTNITVFINATVIPNDVNLTIVTVSFYYQIPEKPNRELADIKIVNYNLTTNERSLNVTDSLYPPADVNKFNITIDIIARTNNVSDQTFVTEFPGDYPYIEVKREKVLPIINLPGFPHIESFSRWIAIFLFSTAFLSLPAIFVGIRKINEYIKIRKSKRN